MAAHTIYVRATALPDVRGRVNYISSPKRQEHLEAFYSTADKIFWKDLSVHCQEQAKYSKSKKACESREFMTALANELYGYNPEELAAFISERIKTKSGTENAVALHWNKSKSNYHCHIIVAENKKLEQVKEGTIMSRDTYFDAAGKRSTKSKCCADGELLPGCRLIKKGERKIDKIKFGPKEAEISGKQFTLDIKQIMTELQNELLKECRFKAQKSPVKLSEQHEGKNLTDEQKEDVRAKNKLIRAYNEQVDNVLDFTRGYFGESAAKQEEESLLKLRHDIKKYALKDSWIRAISFHLEQLRRKYAEIQQLIKDKTAHKETTKPEQKASLLEQIAVAASEHDRQVNGEDRDKKKIKPEGPNDYDDR